MPRPKIQPSFDFPAQFQARREHGGDTRTRSRKIHRPLLAGMNHHLVLRSERARGQWSFLHRRNRSRVESLIYRQASHRDVQIDRLANVGNHLHLIVRFKTTADFQRFLKAIGGLIVRTVTGARKGYGISAAHSSRLVTVSKTGSSARRKFWDGLAYTRLVTWGRELKMVQAYLAKNTIEAIGFGGARLKIRGSGKNAVAVVVVGAIDPEVDPKKISSDLRRLFK